MLQPVGLRPRDGSTLQLVCRLSYGSLRQDVVIRTGQDVAEANRLSSLQSWRGTTVRVAGVLRSCSARTSIVLKATTTFIVLGLCASRANLAAVGRDVAAASPGSLTLAFGAFLLIPLFGGLRWQVVLRAIGQRTRLATLTCVFSVAMIVGQVLPSLASDGFRAWLIVRRGNQLRPVLHSICLERVCMLLALLALAVATQPLLTERLGPTAPRWCAALLLAAGLVAIGCLAAARHFAPWLGNRTFAHALLSLSADLRRTALSPWVVPIMVTSLLSNLNFVLAIGLLGRALDVAASPSDYLAFVPLVTLATTLPISLGGWGVREGILVALFHTVGVPPDRALALSLATGSFSALAGLPGLAAWAMYSKFPGSVTSLNSHCDSRLKHRWSNIKDLRETPGRATAA